MSEENSNEMPNPGMAPKIARGLLQIASIAPGIGGALSAAAGAWSEHEQEKVNTFFKQWLKMLEDEIKEKEQTIIEILSRLDIQDEKVKERITSHEYQALIRKTFREWAGAESEEKRKCIRNILVNAAGSNVVSDDVIRMFTDWMKMYSELHFKVISVIYSSRGGITRGAIWQELGKPIVREDSSEADLYKLLVRDLSTGGIIRQHRETDYYGNFVKKPTSSRGSSSSTMKSAFDNEESYELTNLGSQFVHYAMTDLPPKIEFRKSTDNEQTGNT